MPTPHKILNSEDASNPATSPIVERDDQDMAVRPHQGKRDNQYVPIQRPDNQEENDTPQQIQQTPIKANSASKNKSTVTKRSVTAPTSQKKKIMTTPLNLTRTSNENDDFRSPSVTMNATSRTKASCKSEITRNEYEELHHRLEMSRKIKQKKLEDEIRAETPFKPKINSSKLKSRSPTKATNDLYENALLKEEKRKQLQMKCEDLECTHHPSTTVNYKFTKPRIPVEKRYLSVPKREKVLKDKPRGSDLFKRLDDIDSQTEQEFTFHPKINEYPTDSDNDGRHAGERLYERAKISQYNKIEAEEIARMKDTENSYTPQINRSFTPTTTFQQRLEQSVKRSHIIHSDQYYDEYYNQNAGRKEGTFHPVINKRSQSLSRKEKNVYTDLYKKAMRQIDNPKPPEEPSFTPQTNKKKTKQLLKGKDNFEERQKRCKKNYDDLEETKIEFELEECTFTPEINDDYYIKSMNETNGSGRYIKTDKDVAERNFEAAREYKKKLEEKKKEKANKEIEDCTFHPRINKAKNLHIRAGKNVYERLYLAQPEHIDYSYKEVPSFHPEINENIPLDESRTQESVFDRLFSLSNNRNENIQNQMEQRRQELEYKGYEECTFHPEINPYDKENVPIWKRTNDYKRIMEKREEKAQEYLKKDCPFTPNTKQSKYDKVYHNRADVWSQLSKPKDYKELEERKKQLEVENCSFKPESYTTPKHKNKKSNIRQRKSKKNNNNDNNDNREQQQEQQQDNNNNNDLVEPQPEEEEEDNDNDNQQRQNQDEDEEMPAPKSKPKEVKKVAKKAIKKKVTTKPEPSNNNNENNNENNNDDELVLSDDDDDNNNNNNNNEEEENVELSDNDNGDDGLYDLDGEAVENNDENLEDEFDDMEITLDEDENNNNKNKPKKSNTKKNIPKAPSTSSDNDNLPSLDPKPEIDEDGPLDNDGIDNDNNTESIIYNDNIKNNNINMAEAVSA